MRLLHAGNPDDTRRLPARPPRRRRADDPRGTLRESLPVHRLPGNRRCRTPRHCARAWCVSRQDMTRLVGQRVLRNEDARLLTGRAMFVDDVQLPGMLHAAFLRSDHAHARLRNVDASRALRRPGVVAVYTANDLGDYWKPGPLLVSPPPIKDLVFREATQVPLVRDKVRHLGEPIAMVVAASRYIAEDAVGDIVADLEALP